MVQWTLLSQEIKENMIPYVFAIYKSYMNLNLSLKLNLNLNQ